MEKMLKPRIILSVVIVFLGLIIAAVPENKTKPYKLTAKQLLDEAKTGKQFMTTDEVADMLVKKDPLLQLIDVRSKAEFDKFSLPGALNIPLNNLLAKENEDILNQSQKMNVFYSNGTLQANEAWMLMRQLGYQNMYVMQGGLNYWAETILNPQQPPATSPDDEFAKYDLRKGAGLTLGGAAPVATPGAVAAPAGGGAKPPMLKSGKKKGASGGCS